METSNPSRRELLRSLAVTGGALAGGLAVARRALAGEPARGAPASHAAPLASVAPGKNTPVPLPFAPGALHGLSEKLIVSHHQNNYGGAVRNLNKVEEELARATAATPPFVVAALRERELNYRNSKALHEAYFANLGGDGKRSGAIGAALAAGFGSDAAWEAQFRAAGLGLAGGSGWVVLALEADGAALRTVAATHHAQALSAGLPLLVLDMYEHSYQMDFGAAAARYLDAFFANLNWDQVNRRLDRARRAAAAWHG